jgi:GNAT superfamily N-acetyltransferase
VVHRDLSSAELEQLASIDRAEHIDGHYVLAGGALLFVPEEVEATSWSPSEVDDRVGRLRELHGAGGSVVGSWVDDRLVALASLDARPVTHTPRVLKLDMLYVDAAHRRQGFARRLVALISERAMEAQAVALYISATPTRNTVDAYLRMGAVLADPPDPHLFELEPEDIHLLLYAVDGGAAINRR